MQRFLRLPEVVHTIGLSRSRIYGLIRAGEFPAPTKLGERAVGWTETSISQWIDQRTAAAAPQQQQTSE